MKHTSPTLLALAALVIAPAAYALDVKDDDVKLGLSFQLQARAEVAKAKDGADNSYNVADGTSTQPDAADFYLRRARFGIKGTYDDYKFAFILRMDQDDKTAAATAVGNRVPEAHQVYVGREFKQGNLTHLVQFGLDYAFFNGANAVAPSTTLLFVDARATEQAALLAPRGVGLKYILTAPNLTWGFDIQNNTGDSANTASNGEGMCYTTRAQFSPEGEWKTTPAESYLGKPGKGVLVSLEYGKNVDDIVTTAVAGFSSVGDIVDTSAVGSEVYFHYNQVSALAELRDVKTYNQTTDFSIKSRVWLAQAGYAIACPVVKGAVMEPAIRYQRINMNRDDKAEAVNYGSAEYGNSGRQIDLGVNYYVHDANTKFALDYANWKAESGDAKANILRAQVQLYF